MQQQTQMMQSSFPPTNITTEQIQKYLDENKKLIMAILDNQNLGKLAECAQYQALLQKNLMYLAAIADAQPPTSTVPSQMAAHPAMQQGVHFMQHPQAGAAMAQQSSMFSQKVPLQFNTPHHQMLDPQQHHVFQGQMGMRPGGANNAQTTLGGSGFGPLSNAIGRGGNKQDNSEAVVNGGDGQGKSASGHGGSDTS